MFKQFDTLFMSNNRAPSPPKKDHVKENLKPRKWLALLFVID